MKSKHVTIWLAVAVLAVFAMAASSPQCARTNDLAVNPSLNTLVGGGDEAVCKNACVQTMQDGQKEEQARYKAAKAACDFALDKAACLANELAIHNAIVAELVSDKDACQFDCTHQQGAGTGGQ